MVSIQLRHILFVCIGFLALMAWIWFFGFKSTEEVESASYSCRIGATATCDWSKFTNRQLDDLSRQIDEARRNR